MNKPHIVSQSSFQAAWINAANILIDNGYVVNNLIVHISNPDLIDGILHDRFNRHANDNDILSPKAVAYTIFPHKLYQRVGNANDLFRAYNGNRGLYRKIKRGWGTYFRRMTMYDESGSSGNQLKRIIDCINERNNTHRAAYTIIIQKPGGETVRPRGGPCLNYIAVQMDGEGSIGLLAVYRNHDFYERSYGNYWGLCNLLCFLAKETNRSPGPLTCISSRAYIGGGRRVFESFLRTL